MKNRVPNLRLEFAKKTDSRNGCRSSHQDRSCEWSLMTSGLSLRMLCTFA